MKFLIVIITIVSGCASPRTHTALGIDYESHPARVAMRWECNGKSFTTSGVGVCEQKLPSQAAVSVKVPPLEGRVIYSNGQLKGTQDFNWSASKESWSNLDLGEIAATFGDWPVAIDVASVDPEVGVIVTRGVIYHRVCDDKTVYCSRLSVRYECAGEEKMTSPGEIGKCSRMSGSAQSFTVDLSNAKPGAKIYVSAPKLTKLLTFTPGPEAFAIKAFSFELPAVPNGASLVGIRLAWIEDGKPTNEETRILLMGFAPQWTGLDQPHYSTGTFVAPVLADRLAVDVYRGRQLVRQLDNNKLSIRYGRPSPGEVACAFAWARESSDQTSFCIDSNLEEVRVP